MKPSPHWLLSARTWLWIARGLVGAGLMASSACAGQSPRARSHAVHINAFRYAPDTIRVAVGDTIVWTNHDVVPHTATGAENRWDTGKIDANAAGWWIADRPGMEQYICAYHPNMRAMVVVSRSR